MLCELLAFHSYINIRYCVALLQSVIVLQSVLWYFELDLLKKPFALSFF